MSSDKENSITVSQGTLEQDMSKARTAEKKKNTTEKNVSLSARQQHFYGSLKDAAKSLGVCPTTLKWIRRQHGIMGWPSRKINKVNRSLRKIQTVLDSVQGVKGGLKFDSATGEFIAVGLLSKNLITKRVHLLMEANFVDNAIKLEEDITMNQARSGSFMEVNVSGQPWGWMAEQSGLNGSEGIKSVCNLSSLEISDGVDPTIRCSGSIVEHNQSMSCSISDSSNGSVEKRFKLQDGSFQLKYLDDEEKWVMLVTDSDFQECLEILNGMGKHSVTFPVRDLPPPISSYGGSNGYLGTGL
ncbi:RWP-RK domain [Arabidopsis suecica]|uniref:RWP-RK domain n=1 Tax=Arabidopsis suecica TaxID=45249 RepID=A0A8T2BNR0_ARASU|nr:RWP-RK domain [Arabidopsis suecica]